MADQFTFSKNVPDVRSTPNVPVIEAHETTKMTSTPEFQSAFQANAEANNQLGAIGAKVAQVASNEIATQLGGQSGKTPHGDLFPPLTDFDKNFAESYRTQAHATLGLQADKLITDSNLKASAASRITPKLIAETQQNITKGLQKIYELAPHEVRPQLEATYGAAQLNQVEQLNKRMLSEQHEDRRNNTILANDKNAELAHSLAASGNFKAAEALIKTTEKLNTSAAASNIGFTPQAGKAGTDAVKQSYINGRLQAEYNNAVSQKKGDEYLKNLATRPDWISDAEYPHAIQSIRSYASTQEGLKAGYENLQLTKFNLAIAENKPITGQMIADLQANVSPQQFVDAQIKLVTATNKSNKLSASAMALAGNFANNNSFAGASPQEKNAAFDLNVGNYIQNSQKEGSNLSLPEAQLHVAMNAAGTIPKYVNLLNEQLSGTNPVDIITGGQSAEVMYQSGNAQKLNGLKPESLAMFEKFQALRTSMPDIEAAQKAHEIVYGKTPEQKEANDSAWTDFVKKNINTKESKASFYLREAAPANSIIRNSEAYALQMGNTFETYFKMLNGDSTTAQKMLQKNVSQTYGETYVNGTKEFTYLPVEKMLNMPEDSIGIIHSDVAIQLDKQFTHTKSLYDAGRSDFYWEVRPKQNINDVRTEFEKVKKSGFTGTSLRAQEKLKDFNTKNGVEVIKHWRGAPPEVYETVLQANPYSTMTTNASNPVSGGWEIMLKSNKGIKSISILDPIAGVVTYRPDKQKLQAQYALLNIWMRQ